MKQYPQAEAVDLLKLLYQNEFGCGHLIDDPVKSLRWLAEELSGLLDDQAENVVEPIGNGLCRLHLRVLKQESLALETFHRFFELSAVRLQGSYEGFLQKSEELVSLCRDSQIPFSETDVRKVIDEWQANGCHPYRHSEVFRAEYHPAYRVVEQQFCDYLPLFCRIDELMIQNTSVLVAIDGDCAAGKTTLAALLRLVYDCNVLPMDHFFLRTEQRTAERLAEVGGNVDYERFKQEVFLPLFDGQRFTYRPYDCSKQELGEEILIEPHPLTIVEGSYSLHPKLADAYHLKVFLSVNSEEQMRRIRIRNGDEMVQRFQSEWIPMEKRYFSVFHVADGCDLLFTSK